jgi:hypothetical protein
LSEVWEYDAAVKSRFLRCNKSSVSMKDFWLSCGHHLTDRNAGGGLLVTDEFVKSYLARPELIPPPEACVAERALHAVLLADPRRHIARGQSAAYETPESIDRPADPASGTGQLR